MRGGSSSSSVDVSLIANAGGEDICVTGEIGGDSIAERPDGKTDCQETDAEAVEDGNETLTGSMDNCGGSGDVGEGPCAGFDRDTGGTVGREASEASEREESSEASEREESVDFGV